jgi:hypothetical protein
MANGAVVFNNANQAMAEEEAKAKEMIATERDMVAKEEEKAERKEAAKEAAGAQDRSGEPPGCPPHRYSVSRIRISIATGVVKIATNTGTIGVNVRDHITVVALARTLHMMLGMLIMSTSL